MRSLRALPFVAALLLAACAHGPSPLTSTERPVEVVTFKVGAEVPKVLREKAKPVDPNDPELPALVASLRAAFEVSGGVGLAAPQVGISRRIMLIKHGTRPKGEERVEVYVNPVLEDQSPQTELDWEACLSVEGVGGLVSRFKRIILTSDPVGGGPRLRSRLADWDARIAQHELDHLDGVLFIDKVTGPLVPMDEMRRRRDELHRKRGWIPEPPVETKAAPLETPAAVTETPTTGDAVMPAEPVETLPEPAETPAAPAEAPPGEPSSGQ